MATFEQLPGELNAVVQASDEVGLTLDFSTSLAGYTVSSEIVSLVSGSLVATPPTTITDAANGVATVAFSEDLMAAFAAGTYRLNVDWIAPGDVARRVLSGLFEVRR